MKLKVKNISYKNMNSFLWKCAGKAPPKQTEHTKLFIQKQRRAKRKKSCSFTLRENERNEKGKRDNTLNNWRIYHFSFCVSRIAHCLCAIANTRLNFPLECYRFFCADHGNHFKSYDYAGKWHRAILIDLNWKMKMYFWER